MIASIFKDDFKNYEILYHKENNLADNMTMGKTKFELKKEIRENKKNLYKNIIEKWAKVELYMIGLVFVILTGLVTNQLYSSSLLSIKKCSLSWGSFFMAHLFVVGSFVLLMIFAKELVSLFVSDVRLQPNKTLLMLPVYLIPIFSQINSALIDLNCQGAYPQIGFSSLLIGVILVKYLFDGLENISLKVKNIQSKELNVNTYLIDSSSDNYASSTLGMKGL